MFWTWSDSNASFQWKPLESRKKQAGLGQVRVRWGRLWLGRWKQSDTLEQAGS